MKVRDYRKLGQFKSHRFVANSARVKLNPLRLDPTRTALLRNRLSATLNAWISEVQRDVADLVEREDVFGLAPNRTDPFAVNAFCPTGQGGGVDPTCKPGTSASVSRVDRPNNYYKFEVSIDGEKAGYLTVKSWPNQGEVVVKQIEIAEKFRRQGLATQLHEAAYQFAKEKGLAYRSDGSAMRSPAAEAYWKKMVTIDKAAFKDGVYERINSPTTNASKAWVTLSDDQKLQAFANWLKVRLKEKAYPQKAETVWNEFLASAMKKGTSRSYQDTKKGKKATQTPDLFAGGEAQFLNSTLSQPTTLDRLKVLVTRAMSEVEGLADNTVKKSVRVLADGLVQGLSPKTIAANLRKELDITKTRAETIARTEIVRAHAEGQLLAMERMQVENVGVAVEWSATGDGKVCPACAPLKGVVLTLNEAKGMIPRHPRCRCAWVPANVGEDASTQKKTQARIQAAVKKSVQAGGSPFNKIGKARPTANESGYDEGKVLSAPELKAFSRLRVSVPDFDDDMPTHNYDPNQPRDSKGRWGTGLGGGTRLLPHPDNVKILKDLPGSTGPKLVETPDGKKWVMKNPGAAKEKQLKNEREADRVYHALGIPTPPSGLQNTATGPVKFSRYIEGGQTLHDWSAGKSEAEKVGMYKKIGQHLAADALLANWDVVGLNHDNILIKDGTPYRIDNGGALKYRAQGSPKGHHFTDSVGELASLRDPYKNPSSATVFKHTTDRDLRGQMKDLLAKKDTILGAIKDPETKAKVQARLADYQAKIDAGFGKAPPAQPAATPPPKPAATVTPTSVPASPANTPSAATHLHSPVGLTDHISKNKGATPFTPLYLDKLKALNPDGIKGGVLYIPTFPAGEKSSLEKVATLEKILPAGTVIKKKGITAAEVAKKLGDQAASDKAKKAASPAPAPAAPTPPPKTPDQAAATVKAKVEAVAGPPPATPPPAAPAAPAPAKFKSKLVQGHHDDLLAAKDDPWKFADKWSTLSKPTKNKILQAYGLGPIGKWMSGGLQKSQLQGKMNAGTTPDPSAVPSQPAAPKAPSVSGKPSPKPGEVIDFTPYAPPIPGNNSSVVFGPSPQPDPEAHEAWRKTLTQQEKNAVESWKSHSSAARKKIAKYFADGAPNAQVQAMLSALQKAPPHSGVLYRGLSGNYAGKVFNAAQAAGEGAFILDTLPHGLSENIAASNNFGGGKLMVRIRAKTAKSIKKEDGFSGDGNTAEKEIIGMPGTKYKVLGTYTGVNISGPGMSMTKYTYVIDLEEM